MLFPDFASPYSAIPGAEFWRWNVQNDELAEDTYRSNGFHAGVCPHFDILKDLALLANAPRDSRVVTGTIEEEARYCGVWWCPVHDIRAALAPTDKTGTLRFPEMFCWRLYQELRRQFSQVESLITSTLKEGQDVEVGARVFIGPTGWDALRDQLNGLQQICAGSETVRYWRKLLDCPSASPEDLLKSVREKTQLLNKMLGFEEEPECVVILKIIQNPNMLLSTIKCDLIPETNVSWTI